MSSRSPHTTVLPPRTSISWEAEAPTLRLPVVAPAPPPARGQARRAVKRILVGLLVLLVGLVLLGALLPPPDAVPSATDAVPPAITGTVPSPVAPPRPAESVEDVPPAPVGGPVPEPAAPTTVDPQSVGGSAATTPSVPARRTAVPSAVPPPAEPAQTPRASASYANCAAVRAAGAAPIRRGDPGYSSKLDRDGDGVGCEN